MSPMDEVGRLRADLVPGGQLQLFQGPAQVRWADESLIGEATVTFDWFAGTYLDMAGAGSVPYMFGEDLVEVHLDGLGVLSFEGSFEYHSLPDGWRAEARVDSAVLGTPDARLARLDFAVGNLAPFLRTRGRNPGDGEQLLLPGDGWTVRLDQLPDARERFARVKRSRSGATMHGGALIRDDGAEFHWSDALDVLDALTLFLTFASGDRTPVLLPVGVDSDEGPVVRAWTDPKREGYRGRLSWWSRHRPDTLEEIWPRFLERWSRDATFRQTFRVLVEFCCEAQLGNLETKLVATQAALELLSWHWLTEQEPPLPAATVDGKKAAWRIRRMLERVGVDRAVPETLAAVRQQWPGDDGATVISTLRNSITHPKEVEALIALDRTAKHDVLRLAMWYLDLGVLRLLRHNGDYQRRTAPLPLNEGTTEPVPWAVRAAP